MPVDEMYRSAVAVADVYEVIRRTCTGKRVLDVGCANDGPTLGTVDAAVVAASASCVGVDVADAVHLLQPSEKVRYVQQDAEQLDLDEVFDVVFVGDVIEHLGNPGEFLTRARSVLAPGGEIVIVTPNPFGFRSFAGLLRHTEPPSDPGHVAYFGVEMLDRLLGRAGYRTMDLYWIAGQTRADGESAKLRVYQAAYHGLLRLPGAKRFADTFAVVATH